MHRPMTRRRFLETVGAAGAVAGLVQFPMFRAFASDEAATPLKVLVLGGTGQTGPHLIRQLVERGHVVTMFNRGNRSDELFPDLECLIGDRALDAEDGLASLEAELAAGRTWDLCIDIWPQIPLQVETTALMLRERVGRYMFVSSMGVYTDNAVHDGDEDTPVGEAPDADRTEYTMELFGPFKAECENRVRRIYPDAHTIFRPGLIVGPRDFSFRGGYWPVRVRRGGEVFAPGDGSDPVQIVDGRDLTRFEVLCMENGIGGTFNVTGPHPSTPLTMRGMLEACRAASDSDAEFVWADQDFLDAHEVSAWTDMPCWLPGEGEWGGFCRRNIDKAVAAGLTFRPLVDTFRDTLAWFDGLEEERRESVGRRVGLTAEREAELLAAWHEAKG
jgi:2'-hydroxyisoflavone reductase